METSKKEGVRQGDSLSPLLFKTCIVWIKEFRVWSKNSNYVKMQTWIIDEKNVSNAIMFFIRNKIYYENINLLINNTENFEF